MAPADPLIGRTLGGFVVRARIGHGGFGAVYLAEQPALDRDAVIKVLHERHRAAAEATERFLREAKLASRLEHPYAAHVYAFAAEDDGLLWIAMERVRGVPLNNWLAARGPMSLPQLVPLLQQICEVVHTAHEQGIVHRDIKPANVMVISRAGRLMPKLLDFGIAKGGIHVPSQTPPRTVALALDPTTIAIDDTRVDSRPQAATTGDGALTQANQGVGSPPYMAPEQWGDAASADARTDIYALGVLAFEALTGAPPFTGNTAELAEAHSTAPVPRLGDGFPERLDCVIARALAKRRDDRFSDALAFASAMREASGVELPPAPLPRLPDDVRDDWLGDGPQPIAEAIAALDAARNAHQARDAALEVGRAIVRYVGVVALAARSRVGASRGPDADAIASALRDLRGTGLDDSDWLALARALCKPFFDRAEAHPVPALVQLLRDHDATAPLDELCRLRTSSNTSLRGSEPALRERLATLLPRLAVALRAIDFARDYQLVVRPAGEPYLERWMGVRRANRGSMPCVDPETPTGVPLLVDVCGEPAVALDPIAQVAAPAPGVAPELFWIEGPGRHGARLVALPLGFELHSDAPWEWIRAHFLTAAGGGDGDAAGGDNPYPGLAAFTADDADSFFGREREVESAVNRLRVQQVLCVVGPSGAGKSSFVHAGVVPSLPVTWRTVTLRPGRTPALPPLPDAAVPVVVVDQLEELFTLCADDERRRAFAAALAASPAKIVMTLRDDFLARAQQLSSLRPLLSGSLLLLGTPSPDDLRRIVTEPARRAGYTFEDPSMPDEMIAAVADRPGALALLAFTASRLWELRDRHFHKLPRKVYDSLGGVGGALAHHAETLLEQMSADERKQTREAFRHLVTAEGTRAILSRSELADLLGEDSTVVEQLVSARLLVARESDDGDDQIELAHEALITAWPRLADWRREEVEGARLRDQLREAARQWDARGRPRGLLWRDEALTELELWRARVPGQLTATETAFARASTADATRGRRVRRALVAIAFAILSVALVVVLQLRERAARATDRAAALATATKARLADRYIDQGRQALLAGDHRHALLYLEQGYALGARGPAVELLLGNAMEPFRSVRFVVDHDDRVWHAAYSPDGRWIATASADGTAALWDARTGARRAELRGHDAGVFRVAFMPDGARVVTASWDGSARLWSVPDGREGHVLAAGHGGVFGLAVSPSGELLATAHTDGTVAVWDAVTGRRRHTVAMHADVVNALAFAPNGNAIVTGAEDGGVGLLAVDTGVARKLRPHARAVYSVAIDPRGRWFVTGSLDGTANVYDSKGVFVALEGHEGPVDWVAFDPSGDRLVTTGPDGTTRVWDTASWRQLLVLRGHSARVPMAVFSPDGDAILTTSEDSTARVWDAATGLERAVFPGHAGPLMWAAWSPDGATALTAGSDGTARAWEVTAQSNAPIAGASGASAHTLRVAADHLVVGGARHSAVISLARPSPPVALEGGAVHALAVDVRSQRVFGATAGALKTWRVSDGALVDTIDSTAELDTIAVTPGGDRLVGLTRDSTVGVWALRDGEMVRTLELDTARTISFAVDPGGTWLVTGGFDSAIRVWRLADGTAAGRVDVHQDAVGALAFDATGELVASGSRDGTAKIWRRASGDVVASLIGHRGPIEHIELDIEGALLATVSYDGTARVWDVASGRSLFVIRRRAPIVDARFGPNGASLIVATGNGEVWEHLLRRFDGTGTTLAQTVREWTRLVLVDGTPVPIARRAGSR